MRISDLLEFRWRDVYDDVKRKFRTHVVLTEQKTGKCSVIYLNESATSALEWYQSTFACVPQGNAYLFTNDRQEPLSRVQAYRIVRHAAQQCDIEGIGNDFIADTLDMSLVDEVIKVNDDEAFGGARELARKEGIIGGSSTGAAFAAVKKLIEQKKIGNIVFIAPDRGERYFSKGLWDFEKGGEAQAL